MQRQRIGLILGLIAWCMQLVVFVQPFLPGHTVPGFGICQTIVDALIPSRQGPQAPAHSRDLHFLPPVQAQAQQAIAAKNTAIQATATQATALPPAGYQHAAHAPPQVVPEQLAQHSVSPASHHDGHYLSHLSCGFCALYGHVIPLPALQPFWSAAVPRVYITLPRFSYSAVFVVIPDYIKPQSRAPPAYYIT